MKQALPILAAALFAFAGYTANAQQRLETGPKMPNEWIDKDTGHKVIKLTRNAGDNRSFYFHNNPFLKQQKQEGDKMVYYSTDASGKTNLYSVNLKTLKTEQLTQNATGAKGEILAPKHREAFYQRNDSVFATHIDTKKTRLVHVLPAGKGASISTINADETVLGGSYAGPEKAAIYAKYPEKSDYFSRIYDAKIPHTLFTVNLKTGETKDVYQENTWLGHIQFSPTDPNLLMFCHEGPWHKVDRIWTVNLKNNEVKKMHTRTMDMEIAGHEFFSRDGKTIWFDQQLPKGENFFLTGTEIATGKQKQYKLDRNAWSIHFNISPDQKLFAGDGGDPGQVAKAEDGMWIYLLRPEGNRLKQERLVNMKHHGYKLEPNIHFSPDGKWIVFRANFEGASQVYAVEIEKSKSL